MKDDSEVRAPSTKSSEVLNQNPNKINTSDNSSVSPNQAVGCLRSGLFSCQSASVTIGATTLTLVYLNKPMWKMSLFAQEQYSTELLFITVQRARVKSEYNYLLKDICQHEFPKRLQLQPLKPQEHIYKHLLLSNLDNFRKQDEGSHKKSHVKEWEALESMLQECFERIIAQEYTSLTMNYPLKEYQGRVNKNFLLLLKQFIAQRSTLDMKPLKQIVILVQDETIFDKIQVHFFEAFRPSEK